MSNDIGDRNPGDADDVAPIVNPLAGVDPQPAFNRKKPGFKLEQVDRFRPDFNLPQPNVRPRDFISGRILNADAPFEFNGNKNYYEVQLDNEIIVDAYYPGQTPIHYYEDFQVVQVGQHHGEYVIITPPHFREVKLFWTATDVLHPGGTATGTMDYYDPVANVIVTTVNNLTVTDLLKRNFVLIGERIEVKLVEDSIYVPLDSYGLFRKGKTTVVVVDEVDVQSAYVYREGVQAVYADTTPVIVDVTMNWAEGGRDFHENLEVYVKYNIEEDQWEIIPTEHYRLIRGQAASNVSSGLSTFIINNVVVLAGGYSPGSSVTVANVHSQEYSLGQYVLAVYSPNVSGVVDWEALPLGGGGGGGSGLPPLRRFEYYTAKEQSDDTASVKWLDDAGNMIGDPVTVHDPEHKYYGAVADYIDEEPGFHGMALERMDIGGVESNRWEIIESDTYAEWIVAEYFYNEGVGNEWRLIEFGHGRQPADFEEALNVIDPIDAWSHNLHIGEQALCRLIDEGPQYAIVALRQRSDIVQVQSVSGGDPAEYPVGPVGDVFPGRLVGLLGVNPSSSDTVSHIYITDLSGAPTLPNKRFYLAQFVGIYVDRPRFAIQSTSAGEDNYTVRVTATDSTPEYLQDSLQDTATFVNEVDGVIKGDKVGDDATNQKLKLFLDSSAIPYYSASGVRRLSLDNNVLKWMEPTPGTSADPETYRLIRGRAVANVASSDAYFEIDEVEALAGGLDPSSGNPATLIKVENFHNDRYAQDDWVIAAYNFHVRETPVIDWEALPKHEGESSSGGDLYTCRIDSPISAGAADAPAEGTGLVWRISEDGAAESLGVRTIYNPFPHPIQGDQTCHLTFQADELTDDQFTLCSYDLVGTLKLFADFASDRYFGVAPGGTIKWMPFECVEVVTGGGCVDGEVVLNTTTIYVGGTGCTVEVE